MKLTSQILKSSLFVLFMTTAATAQATQSQIVGGDVAIPHSYPFIGSLQTTEFSPAFHFCGGSLINETTFVTAAHCMGHYSSNEMQVVLGAHRLNNQESTQQIIPVASYVVNPSYDGQANDVAIIKLAEPAVYNKYVQPISLPAYDKEHFEGVVRIIGWGTLSSGGKTPNRLRETQVDIVDHDTCDSAYDRENITEGMICASRHGKDTCQGDSGGPMFQGNTLVGVTSWGYGCAYDGYPGVYTNVSHYLDFITENM